MKSMSWGGSGKNPKMQQNLQQSGRMEQESLSGRGERDES